MIIQELKEDEDKNLEEFKAKEWPVADREHYGTEKVDFSRHKKTLLAKNDVGTILGYATFIVDTGVCLIDSILVGQRFQGQGIASRLMMEIEAQAKFLGAHKSWLETGSNWKAKMLYEKLGYHVRAILPNHYAGREFVLMDKEI